MKTATCACGEMQWTGTTGPKLCAACTHCGTAIGGGAPEPHNWVQAFDEYSGDSYEECARCLRKVDVRPPRMADMGHQLRQEQLTTQALNSTIARLTRERDELKARIDAGMAAHAEDRAARDWLARERDKAVRERDEAESRVAYLTAPAQIDAALADHVALLERERDEARAELERLRMLLDISREHNVPELLDHYWQWSKSAERTRVVTWLRGQGAWEKDIANAIEAGEHDE